MEIKQLFWVYGEETGILSTRQSEKETVVSPYNSEPPGTLINRTSKWKTIYRVYSEETGVLPLRQGEKETVDSLYNSEYKLPEFLPDLEFDITNQI